VAGVGRTTTDTWCREDDGDGEEGQKAAAHDGLDGVHVGPTCHGCGDEARKHKTSSW
jgi:hypothetical protein